MLLKINNGIFHLQRLKMMSCSSFLYITRSLEVGIYGIPLVAQCLLPCGYKISPPILANACFQCNEKDKEPC